MLRALSMPTFWNNFTGSRLLNESSSSWCSLSTKLSMARLPNIFLNCFEFTLHQGIFDQVPCFFSLNPSLDTHGDRSFSSAAPRIWNSLPLILRSCLCTTYFKSFLKTYLMSQVFNDYFCCVCFFVFCFVCFLFYCALNTQQVDTCALQALLLFFLLLSNVTPQNWP